jgi:hypothetical protein
MNSRHAPPRFTGRVMRDLSCQYSLSSPTLTCTTTCFDGVVPLLLRFQDSIRQQVAQVHTNHVVGFLIEPLCSYPVMRHRDTSAQAPVTDKLSSIQLLLSNLGICMLSRCHSRVMYWSNLILLCAFASAMKLTDRARIGTFANT